MEKGVKALPDNWRLRQDLGFFHYLFLHDAQAASRVLLEAAEVPGAAFWLRTLAADLLAKGGDRADSRRMWTQMYQQAEEGIIRENARVRLQILDSLDRADALGPAVLEFERRQGRRPARPRGARARRACRGARSPTWRACRSAMMPRRGGSSSRRPRRCGGPSDSPETIDDARVHSLACLASRGRARRSSRSRPAPRRPRPR